MARGKMEDSSDVGRHLVWLGGMLFLSTIGQYGNLTGKNGWMLMHCRVCSILDQAALGFSLRGLAVCSDVKGRLLLSLGVPNEAEEVDFALLHCGKCEAAWHK